MDLFSLNDLNHFLYTTFFGFQFTLERTNVTSSSMVILLRPTMNFTLILLKNFCWNLFMRVVHVHIRIRIRIHMSNCILYLVSEMKYHDNEIGFEQKLIYSSPFR